MKCPKCEKLGQKSRVYVIMSATKAMGGMPFYDEDGKYHVDGPLLTTIKYICFNGHSWEKVSGSSCWCGWPKKETKG